MCARDSWHRLMPRDRATVVAGRYAQSDTRDDIRDAPRDKRRANKRI